MLNDAERRSLLAIESLLRAEDPRFARRFEERSRRWSRRAWPGLVALLVALVSVGLAVGGLVEGSVVTVVAAVTVVGVACGSWITLQATR